MNYNLLCIRGTNTYLVSRDDEYCLVNLGTGKYNASAEAGVFLKLGYFEDIDEVSAEVDEKIKAIISDDSKRVEIK